MSEEEREAIIKDKLNLEILERVCQGKGISFNISQLSSKLNRHRSTIKKRIDSLLDHKIINKPACSFTYMYREYPLFVVVFADFPDETLVDDWIKNDKQIFAAYNIREEEYNIMIFEFHKSLTHYQQWRESLIVERKIPPRENRRASTSLFFSSDLQIKNEPESSIDILEKIFIEKKKNDVNVVINGYKIDKLDLDILRALLNGEGIKINENLLSKKLNSHRKTIENRIKKLIANEIIKAPQCQFPQFFLPANLLLVFSLIDFRDVDSRIYDTLKKDEHIPILFKVSIGKYNCLMFSVHENIDDFLEWNINYRNRFPKVFGIEKINYLSPRMTKFVDVQKIALGIIGSKLKEIKEE